MTRGRCEPSVHGRMLSHRLLGASTVSCRQAACGWWAVAAAHLGRRQQQVQLLSLQRYQVPRALHVWPAKPNVNECMVRLRGLTNVPCRLGTVRHGVCAGTAC